MSQKDIDAFAVLIRRRYRISQRAAKLEARERRNSRMVDYHSGAMGVCLCLLGDIGATLRPKRKKK